VARNVELKAAVDGFAHVNRVLAGLTRAEPIELDQDDTFFHCPRGRLKLRRFSATAGELIYYRRPDAAGPKTSHYVLAPTTEPDRLREALTAAYGVAGVVRKHRIVRLVGRTRVHLDTVEHLGTFVELEVVLEESEDADRGASEAHQLMAVLGIGEDQLVAGAYVDLLPYNPGHPGTRTG
jgi:adenylate cyclase class IV